jgi:hypothetical protein
MTKLELLYAQKSKKLEQLCAVAARELGYGELSTLSVTDRSVLTIKSSNMWSSGKKRWR